MGSIGNILYKENTLPGKKDPNLSLDDFNKFLGLTIIQFLSILFILTQMLFYVGISVNFGTFILAVLITYLILFFSIFYDHKRANNSGNALRSTIILSSIVSVVFIILFVISIVFGSMFIDSSYDANAYHKPYSLFFVNGWNPIKEHNAPELFEGKLQGIDHKGNTYPKASELIASYVYLLSNSLESVKAINLIILFSSLAITVFTFLAFLPEKRIIAVIISVTAVLNPVWITQSTQFSIDGFTFELFLILICLILIYIKGHDNWYILLSLLLGSVLLITTKGSALLFIPLIMVMFLVLVWFFCRHKTRDIIIFLIILLGLSFSIGFSPYMENYIKYKSPLGQEFGEDLVTSPENYTQYFSGYTNDYVPNWLVPRDLFIKSLFSPVSSKYEGMKNPFDIKLSELENLHGSTKINGYGPFCGLIISLSIVSLIFIIINKKNPDAVILLISIFFIFLTVILHPACWWARFVPQFFLIPVFIGLIGYVNGNFLYKVISSVLLIVLIINLVFVGHNTYSTSLTETNSYHHELTDIKNEAQFPVGLKNTFPHTVNQGLASPVSAVLLEENGIPWEMCSNKFNCTHMTKKKTLIYYTDILYRPVKILYSPPAP